jgi:hypothetical protein
MSVFTIAKIKGKHEHVGLLEVCTIGQTDPDKRSPFSVTLVHNSGASSFHFGLTPDQSRDLRKALEDAEAKAEILTAAI